MQEAATKIQAEAKGLLGFPEVHKEVMRRDLIESARQLKAGFLETDDMRQLIEQVVPSLVEGMPLLLFGETGGAKTALGRHLALEYFGVDPEMVSGHAEVNAYQVMGKTGLRASGEGTESVFDPGPMFTAMAEGKPCILDEVDAMPASFLLRLQYILQLRPGDTYKVQEDSNESITVKAGFCIIATANMKSARYIREKMDPAFMQRFRSGAGIKHIPYPDNDITEGGVPTDNIRLMLAFLADEKGATREVPGISRASEDKRLFNLMKAAHASQRMFTQPASTLSGASQSMVLDSGRLAQGKPALDEAVLAPREWMGILSQVINSDGKVTLENALADFVAGQTVDNDRAVLGRLLAAHDLLDGVNEADLRLPPGALNGFRKTVVAAPEAPDATPATP